MAFIDFFRKKKVVENLSESLSEDKWDRIVDKAIKNYNSLSNNEMIWYNIRVLIDAVNNGGLISYYYNYGAENIYDTIRCLSILQMDSIIRIIEHFNHILFGESKVPQDIDIRNEYISSLTEEQDTQLEILENEMTFLIDELGERLKKYLNGKLLSD